MTFTSQPAILKLTNAVLKQKLFYNQQSSLPLATFLGQIKSPAPKVQEIILQIINQKILGEIPETLTEIAKSLAKIKFSDSTAQRDLADIIYNQTLGTNVNTIETLTQSLEHMEFTDTDALQTILNAIEKQKLSNSPQSLESISAFIDFNKCPRTSKQQLQNIRNKLSLNKSDSGKMDSLSIDHDNYDASQHINRNQNRDSISNVQRRESLGITTNPIVRQKSNSQSGSEKNSGDDNLEKDNSAKDQF